MKLTQTNEYEWMETIIMIYLKYFCLEGMDDSVWGDNPPQCIFPERNTDL